MHVVLVGDEGQLYAMVTSDVGIWEKLVWPIEFTRASEEVANVQHRMHHLISLFPKREFCYNQIMDAEYVKSESYEKSYLEGEMFGSYSFIDVAVGREEKDDDRRSRTNMVEVAVVVGYCCQNAQSEWEKSKNKLLVWYLPMRPKFFTFRKR
ncbi:putative DNA2/NAM7 helicase-like protein [Helianthus anomalus]